MEYDDRTVTSRRSVLAAAGGLGIAGAAAALGGCSTYDSTRPPPQPSPQRAPDSSGAADAAAPDDGATDSGVTDDGVDDDGSGGNGGNGGGGGAVGNALAKTSDIPVGGGKIFANQQLVVTQP